MREHRIEMYESKVIREKIKICRDILHQFSYASYMKDDTCFKAIKGNTYPEEKRRGNRKMWKGIDL